MLDTVTAADFQPLLGKTFTVALENMEEPFILAAAAPTRYAAHCPPDMRAPFFLHFEGPAGGRFRGQSLYRVTHPAFSQPLDLMLVPIGETVEHAIILEAIFG